MHHFLQLHPRQLRLSGSTLLVIGCAILVIGCPLLLGVRDVRSHNLQLARVADSLYGLALPPNTGYGNDSCVGWPQNITITLLPDYGSAEL
jgi:hypothetical protein